MSDHVSKQLQVALYARVSTEEQREGQTIESQIAELERFVREKGWVIKGTYKDDGWSGSILARPELDRLRDDGTKGSFDAIIVNDVDRLARDVAHLGIIKRDFEAKRIQLVFRKLPGESSPTYNLMVNILGSFAEFEREVIIDRTRRGRRHKVEIRKQYIGCVAPYGYHYETGSATNGNAAKLRIVPAEARVVKQIYQWSSTGLSMNKIVSRLNDSGILPRKGKKGWASATILIILRSEVYAGIWSYCKRESREPQKRRTHNLYRRQTKTSRLIKPKSEWLRVTLPEDLRIIDPAFWKKVQDRIDRNPKFSPRNAKYFYLLQGLLRCAYCNGAYSGTFRVRKTGRVWFWYGCWKRCPQSRQIRKDDLDFAVWSAVHDALMHPEHLETRISEAKADLSKEGAETSALNLRPPVHMIEDESRLFKDYQAGGLSAAQLATALESLKMQRAVQQGQEPDRDIMKIPRPTVNLSVQDTCREFARLLKDASPEMRQEVLRRLDVTARIYADRVRIRARIPSSDQRSDFRGKGIALSHSRRSERNTPSFDFELTRALPDKLPRRAAT